MTIPNIAGLNALEDTRGMNCQFDICGCACAHQFLSKFGAFLIQ